MTPPTTEIDIAETNIANLGTEIERKVKEASAGTEKAWQAVKDGEIGLWVWRIEQFKVVPVPAQDLGKFYTGDSYIVLKSYKPSPDAEKLAYNLFFWLGKHTTQDEAGTAAYKTVELDTYLKDDPVQYREIQGYESSTFLGYFPQFMVLEGGVQSGFRHVDVDALDKAPVRLLQVKGKGKGLVARQVEAKREALNAGDVFVLDAGKVVIQWNGEKSSPFEKAKGAQVAQALAGERQGKAKVIVIEQATYTPDHSLFFSKLEGGEGPIADAVPDTLQPRAPLALYSLSNGSSGGPLEFKHVKTGGITKADLKSEDAFIVDGGFQVVVWVGKHASAEEKTHGVAFAEKFLTEQKRTKLAQIVRVVEGGECPILDELIRGQ